MSGYHRIDSESDDDTRISVSSEQKDDGPKSLADISSPDVYLDMEGYEGAIWGRMWVVGLSLAGSLAINIVLVVEKRGSKLGYLPLGLQAFALILLCMSALFSPSIRLGQPKRTVILPNHATTCVLLTFSSLAAIVATVWLHWGETEGLWMTQLAPLLLAFAAAGTMRRGPKRLYRMPPTEMGLGSVAQDRANPMRSVFEFHSSSVLSCFWMIYITGVFRDAFKQERLEESDVPHLPAEHRGENLYAAHRDYYNLTGANGIVTFTEWSLLRYVWRGFGKSLLIGCCACTVEGLFSLASPWILHRFLALFEGGQADKVQGYTWCFLMFICMFVKNGVNSWTYMQENVDLHQPSRIVIETLLYAKLLRTKNAEGRESRHNSVDHAGTNDEETDRSQILNLFTDDANQIASIVAHVGGPVFNGVFSFTIGCALLYRMLSWSALLGLVIAAVGALGNYAFANRISRINKTLYSWSDKRISLIKELLFSIKVIKLNAWEPQYLTHVGALRETQLRYQRMRTWCYTWLNVYGAGLPLVTLLVVFGSYTIVEGRQLTASTAFVSLWIFGVVRHSMGLIPRAINATMTIRIALQRLVRFLNSPEFEQRHSSAGGQTIVCKGVDIGWPAVTETANFFLTNITFEVSEGLTLVSGPTASGKTLLLLGLLGEAETRGGMSTPWSSPDSIPLSKTTYNGQLPSDLEVNWLNGTVAYSPQTAYIYHGTLKSNILFGQDYWPQRYFNILEACSLNLSDFPDLDETEIGEGGHNLSGGQRARIGLARSLYSRASTLILDDVLSAVDAATASHIIQRIQPLIIGRITVLVTHQVSLCRPFASRWLRLDNGTVRTEPSSMSGQWEVYQEDMILPKRTTDSQESLDDYNRAFEEGPEKAKKPRQLVKEEERRSGRVSYTGDYGFVLSSLDVFGWFGAYLLCLYILRQALNIAEPKVLELWTSKVSDVARTKHYLSLYAAIIVTSLVFNVVKEAHLFNAFKKASWVMHQRLISALVAAPLLFHESVPKGRILNRCSDDITQIDTNLPNGFDRAFTAILEILGSILVIALSAPGFLIATAVVTPFACIIGKALSKIRSETRRFSAVSQSPLGSMYVETLVSLPVIRAFGAQDAYLLKTLRILDTYRRAGVWEYAGYNVFQFGVKSISSFVVASTAIVLLQRENMSAAEAGFILTFALSCSDGVLTLMHVLTDLDVDMVAVERVREYCSISPEVNFKALVTTKPAAWPSEGKLEIRDLRVKYDEDLPEVLHGLNIDIKAGERVGIVGPTGHGKSTLALSIFRAVSYTGQICIDGIDISSLALDDLRGSLSMIPQEPTWMSGTLRESLDIAGTHPDAAIYDALRRSFLLDDNGGLFSDLETRVEPGGANFSHGQRQLLCLARALLKPSKLLVFDEFTSSLDYETDAKVTTTLRHAFQGSTVICIAHRLATVVGFDRILVIKEGSVVEFDTPGNLLSDAGSAFHGLCAANGEAELHRLIRLSTVEE